MSNQNQMIKQDNKEIRKTGIPHRAARPNVDIYEDKQGITLIADLPGVATEGLDIQVDQEILSIDAQIDIPMPSGQDLHVAGTRPTRYQRSFTISNELDVDNIEAVLKNGVLAMRIPKREQYQPRKINIRAA
ncbi:MAG: Hsp20/alpha crystallin family protein [Candidatus Thiodiazotropha sp.]